MASGDITLVRNCRGVSGRAVASERNITTLSPMFDPAVFARVGQSGIRRINPPFSGQSHSLGVCDMSVKLVEVPSL